MQHLLQQLKDGETSIAVVGLGYVGLPLAVHLSRIFKVVGFDIKQSRIDRLNAGFDDTGEVDNEDLAGAEINFSADPQVLRQAPLIIVAVPTPIDEARNPDLRPLISSSRTVGAHMPKGCIVVYESTVYPGATEEVCVPQLVEASGLTYGEDFFIGYSPERINPGDKCHTFDKITKVVSGQTPEICDLLAEVYGMVVSAGIHKASSVKTAEAAKVIENTQRDLNIALMNELAIIFNELDIDTNEVLEAAGTKWNFLPFRPGLVGGHCIGVDPYYLTYQAQRLGHHPEVVLAGRRINDSMSRFVAEQTVKHMIRAGFSVRGARILVLGLTFKEDVPDLRNSKVFDVVKELRDYQLEVLLHDPLAPEEDLADEYQEHNTQAVPGMEVDAIIWAVKHAVYLDWGLERIASFAKKGALLVDVKAAVDADQAAACGMTYWRL